MKKILLVAIVLVSVFSVKAEKPKSKIQVFYFHMQRRCATCLAVEEEARNVLIINFNKEYVEGKIELISVNIENNENSELVKKWQVTGQSLLIVKGDKKVNLTSKAFLYARTKPSKYHEALIKAIQTI